MIKRRNSTGLRRGLRRTEEDVNPNTYITNMTDVMLVVILGLLVALIARYNIDLNAVPKDEIVGIQINMDQDQDGQVDTNYEPAGTVYQDPETGNFYLVEG